MASRTNTTPAATPVAKADQESLVCGKLTVKSIVDGKVAIGDIVRIGGRIDSRKVTATNLGDSVCFTGSFAGQKIDDKGNVQRTVLANRLYVPHIAENQLAAVEDGSEFKLMLVAVANEKSTTGYEFRLKLDSEGIASNPGLRLLAGK
jgi:hypothetical protein